MHEIQIFMNQNHLTCKFSKKICSSMAEFPPPTTTTYLEKTITVAHGTPCPISSSSDFKPNRRADAPVETTGRMHSIYFYLLLLEMVY